MNTEWGGDSDLDPNNHQKKLDIKEINPVGHKTLQESMKPSSAPPLNITVRGSGVRAFNYCGVLTRFEDGCHRASLRQVELRPTASQCLWDDRGNGKGLVKSIWWKPFLREKKKNRYLPSAALIVAPKIFLFLISRTIHCYTTSHLTSHCCRSKVISLSLLNWKLDVWKGRNSF